MAQTWEDKAGQHTASEPIFLHEEGALHTSDEFQMVCADCGNSHEIEVAIAPDGTPVYWPSFRISLLS